MKRTRIAVVVIATAALAGLLTYEPPQPERSTAPAECGCQYGAEHECGYAGWLDWLWGKPVKRSRTVDWGERV